MELASAVGHMLRAAGPCPSNEAWAATKLCIKAELDKAGITGKEFDASLKAVAGRKRVTKLERMGL